MPRGKSSGITLTRSDAAVVLGMIARDDREHDIAAWFGVNQGRIADVKAGDYGPVTAAPAASLPPKGPPGVKGRRLYANVQRARALLDERGADALDEVRQMLADAQARYDTDET